MQFKDLTGTRFGRLIVVGRTENRLSVSGRPRVRWICRCDCGSDCIVDGDNLKRGKIVSCGCYKKEYLSRIHSTHGASKTSLYGIWCAMKSRCYNKKSKYFALYGGRGISICNEWKNNFNSFQDWALNHGYKDGLSIDRINNDDNYKPDNCRWTTCTVQANNRRSNHILEFNGQKHNIKEWSDIIGIPYKTLYSRISSGWDIEKALTE